jgi:hypothetical protein
MKIPCLISVSSSPTTKEIPSLAFVEERTYRLEGQLETLDQIEQATERFKREALPQIEHSLLARAQQRLVVADRRGKAQPPPSSAS